LKYLLVIGLVLLLLAMLYRRLRPYLKIVREFLNTVRQFRINSNQGGREKSEQHAEKLVRCEACGTWVPIGRALTSRTGTFFCSEDCRTGQVAQRRSAS